MLKLFARIETRDLAAEPGLRAALDLARYRAVIERAFVLHLEARRWTLSPFDLGSRERSL